MKLQPTSFLRLVFFLVCSLSHVPEFLIALPGRVNLYGLWPSPSTGWSCKIQRIQGPGLKCISVSSPPKV